MNSFLLQQTKNRLDELFDQMSEFPKEEVAEPCQVSCDPRKHVLKVTTETRKKCGVC